MAKTTDPLAPSLRRGPMRHHGCRAVTLNLAGIAGLPGRGEPRSRSLALRRAMLSDVDRRDHHNLADTERRSCTPFPLSLFTMIFF